MKKEKIIKTHTRKTKSGKTVTVRQHTAKYDAADEAKKLAKKIGAGKEFKDKRDRVFDKDLWEDLLQSNEASEYHKVWDELEMGLNEERETGKPFSTGKYKNLEKKMNPIKDLLDKKHGKGAANFLENNIQDYVTYNKDGRSSLRIKPSKSKKAIEKTPKYTATSDLYDKKTHSEFLKKLRNKYDISKVFTDKRKKWRTVTIYGYGNNSRPFGGKEEEVKKAISRQYPGAKIQKIDKKYYLSGFRVYLPHKKDN